MTHILAVIAGTRPTRWSTAAAAATATAHKQPHNDLVTQLSTVNTRSNNNNMQQQQQQTTRQRNQ